nr:hypothetical protein [Candidatus Njordarchaeota archaeon]
MEIQKEDKLEHRISKVWYSSKQVIDSSNLSPEDHLLRMFYPEPEVKREGRVRN